jgi:cell filamentation protein
LKNHLGIQNEIDLADAERDLSTLAADRIEFSAPPYDFPFLKLFHHKLFKDIYSWAGEVRSVDVSKGDIRFCSTHRIEPEAEKLFHALAGNN